MKKLIVISSMILSACSSDRIDTNTKTVSGYVLTQGAENPVSGIKVTTGTYGTITSTGSQYAETITDENGFYQLKFSSSQVDAQVFLYYYPEHSFVKSTDVNGQIVTSVLTEFNDLTKNFIVRPPASVLVTVKNTSGKYYRIEGAVKHYPHKSSFFKLEKNQVGTYPMRVWGDDKNSFFIVLSLIDEYGNETKFQEDVPVNIPWKQREKFTFEF